MSTSQEAVPEAPRRPKRVAGIEDCHTHAEMVDRLDRGLHDGYEVSVEVLPNGRYRVWYNVEIDVDEQVPE